MARILVILLMCLLAGCSRIARQDGPPNFYVDETKVPNAVPKSEPLSKYGNMSSYRVFGKRYYTLRSSRHYNKVGIASWYGTMFHDRKTSCGEPYNMLAMTAAHKTLPLPTYVEVTNLANKRKIIVKVNDRGPFESNRIIDLSYVAAKKLGMLGRGTAMVRVKAIDPSTFGKRVVNKWQPSKAAQMVYFQVGVFRNKDNAVKLKRRLVSLLHAPVTVSRHAQNKKMYRVQVGPIKDVSTADKIHSRLSDMGIKPNKRYGTT